MPDFEIKYTINLRFVIKFNIEGDIKAFYQNLKAD